MIKRNRILTLLLAALWIAATPFPLLRAQVSGNSVFKASGNSVYSDSYRTPPASGNLALTDSTMLIDAKVLLNAPADEFVAMFGVTQEAKSIAECGQKIDARIAEFIAALQPLGITAENLYIDFTTQNRVYDYELEGTVAREKLTGFEVKKTISVRYRSKALLDKIIPLAAKSGIYDLIKVDYIVSNLPAVYDKLFEAASRIIKKKEVRYTALGVRFRSPLQVYEEQYRVHAPAEQYASYTAYESGAVQASYRSNVVQKDVRKSQTFFFRPMDGNGFDDVLNPQPLELMVQITLTLKVKYAVVK